jgi:hypothetical protein
MTEYIPPTAKDMDDHLATIFNREKFKKQLSEMSHDEVVDIIQVLYLYHKIPAVMVFHTWDDLVSSASIPDEYESYPFSYEDKRELCSATEEALSEYVTPKIVEQLNDEIETFFLRKKTEEQHFGAESP